MKKKNIELDRKVLSQLAREYPEIFIKVIEEVKA
jgi:ribosomal protein L20